MKARSTWYGIGCGFLAVAAQAFASDGVTSVGFDGHATGPLAQQVLYGIQEQTGVLVKYRFGTREPEIVNHVVLDGFGAIHGIRGMAHVPGHLNIMGFWNDPRDQQTKLLYINSESAKATVVGQNVGQGIVTGATVSGLVEDTGDLDGRVAKMVGGANINPNNSPTAQFRLYDPAEADGVIDRAQVHADEQSEYTGMASEIWVQPKGNGNKNTLTFGGEAVDLKNGHLYRIASASGEADIPYTVWKSQPNGNGKAMGHWWLDVTAPVDVTVTDLATGGVFATQTIETSEEADVSFEIVGGQLMPAEDHAVKLTVLGASPGRNVYVTVQTTLGNQITEPFGNFLDPAAANLNDDANPRRHIASSVYPANTPVGVKAQSWVGTKNGFNKHIAADSNQNSRNVKVLRNGDPVPDTNAFTNPGQNRDFFRDYVDQDSGTVVLDENQAIFLFELTTNDMASSNADFDDLAVIATLAQDPIQLNEDDDDDNDAGPASRLVKVNRQTGGFDQIMTLDRVYTALTGTPKGLFYGTHNNQVYELDPFEQTETLIGDAPSTGMTALESVGTIHLGYSIETGYVAELDVKTGDQVGTEIDISVSDLHSIVFIKESPVDANGYD